MNNSFIAIENVSLELDQPVDQTVRFREQEAELVRIIEALNKVGNSSEWKLLEDLIFKGVVSSLKRDRESEVDRQPLNGPKIHNLNGQIKWAQKYLDLSSFAIIYKQQLVSIRNQLNASKD